MGRFFEELLDQKYLLAEFLGCERSLFCREHSTLTLACAARGWPLSFLEFRGDKLSFFCELIGLKIGRFGPFFV